MCGQCPKSLDLDRMGAVGVALVALAIIAARLLGAWIAWRAA